MRLTRIAFLLCGRQLMCCAAAALGIVGSGAWSGIASGQGAGAASTDTMQAPAAAPADVATIDAIIHALYDVISGPAGPRDWRRFRSLFAPGARLIPTGRDSTGHARIRAISPDDYAQRGATAFQREPFYENEIGRTVETFGSIAQVFTAYASRRTPDGTPFARGINSMQFFYDGTRWYCVTIFWDSERPGLTIPDRYLHTP
jgi:hypothetical protein